jgi:hypothetical protein
MPWAMLNTISIYHPHRHGRPWPSGTGIPLWQRPNGVQPDEKRKPHAPLPDGEAMKDAGFLVFAAVACSAGAWAIWHFLGSDALTTILILAVISIAADNRRLRKKIERK